MQLWVSSAFERKGKKARRSKKGSRGKRRRTGYHERRWALLQGSRTVMH